MVRLHNPSTSREERSAQTVLRAPLTSILTLVWASYPQLQKVAFTPTKSGGEEKLVILGAIQVINSLCDQIKPQ